MFFELAAGGVSISTKMNTNVPACKPKLVKIVLLHGLKTLPPTVWGKVIPFYNDAVHKKGRKLPKFKGLYYYQKALGAF